jgi:hypothetical protein
MGVAAERVTDQNDVVAFGREITVGLVGHPDRVQLSSTVEWHRAGQVEILRVDAADRARCECRR